MPERKVNALLSVTGDSKSGVRALQDVKGSIKDLDAAYKATAKNLGSMGQEVGSSLKKVRTESKSTAKGLQEIGVEASKKHSISVDTDQAQGSVKGLQSSLEGLVAGLTNAQGMMGVFGGAVKALEVSLGKNGAGVKQLEKSYADLFASVNGDGQAMLGAMRTMMGGVVSDVSLMENALRLSSLAGEEFLGALPLLMGIARKQARAMNIDITYALDSIILGFSRGSALILDNLGVMVDQQTALDAYSKSSGIAVENITKQQKSLAILQQIQKNYGADVANMARLEMNEAEAIASVTAQFENAKDTISKAFSPSVASAATVVSSLLKQLQKIPQPVLEIIARFVSLAGSIGAVVGIVHFLGPLLAPLIPVILGLTAVVGTMAVVWQRDFGGLQTKVRGLADTIKSNWQTMAADAIRWGFRLIENYGIGMIQGGSSVIVSALNAIGNVIAGFLRSASPPEEGVLTGIQTWGQGLMNTYLEGMAQADFGILSDATAMIEQGFKYLEGIGVLDSTEVAPWIGEVREEVARLLATFRETGQIDEGLLDLIGSQVGDMGAKIAEYLRLQLEYQQATQKVTEAEKALADVRAAADAKNKRIDRLEALGVSPQIIALMRDQVETEVERAETALEAAQAEADAVAEKLGYQKQYVSALQAGNDLVTRQVQALEAAAKAAEAAAKAAAAGGGGKSTAGIPTIPIDLSLFEGLGGGEGVGGALVSGLQKLGDVAKAEWARIKGEFMAPINDIKAAWEGLKTSFSEAGGVTKAAKLVGKALGGIREKGEDVIGWFKENWEPVMAGVGTFLGIVLIQFIGAAITYFGALATAAIGSAATTALALAPVVLPIVAIGVAVGLLVAAWKNDWGSIRTTLTDFWEGTARPTFETVKTWLETNIPAALTAVKTWWTTTWTDIETAFGTTKTAIVGVLTTVYNWFTITIPGAVESLKQAFFDRMDELNPRWRDDWEAVRKALSDKINEALGNVQTWIKDLLDDIKQFGKDLLKSWNDDVWTPVVNALGTVWTSLQLALGGIITGIKTLFTEVDWESIGKGIIDGVKQGVANAAGGLAQAAANAVNDALNWAKEILGISSPSRVWADEIGANMMSGAAEGVEEGGAGFAAAVQRVLDTISAIAAAFPTEVRADLLEMVALVEASAKSILSVVGVLNSLSRTSVGALSEGQRGAIATGIYGMLDLIRGVAQALQGGMGALGGGDVLTGYAQVQVAIESLSKLLEALEKLGAFNATKLKALSPEQRSLIAEMLYGLLDLARGVAEAMQGGLSALGGGDVLTGYAEVQILAESFSKMLEALAKLGEIDPDKLQFLTPAQLQGVAATAYGLLDAMRGVAQALQQDMGDLGTGDALAGYGQVSALADALSGILGAIGGLAEINPRKFKTLTPDQRAMVADAVYGLLDLARGVAQALQTGMATLGGEDVQAGYAQVAALADSLSGLLGALEGLTTLDTDKLQTLSPEQRTLVADAVYGMIDLARGVAQAMRDGMAELGAEDPLAGYAQVQSMVDAVAGILGVLEGLSSLKPRHLKALSAEQVALIADTIHGLMDALRGVAASMKEGIADLAEGDLTDGYASMQSFAETTQAGMAALEATIAATSIRIKPSQLNRTIAVYDLVKKAIAHWLRRISDLALAWRDKYGGDDSLKWLNDFVDMLSGALGPLQTIIEIAGQIGDLDLFIPTAVFDDLQSNLERAVEAMEGASVGLTGEKGFAIRKRIEKVAPVFTAIGETLSAIVQPFKELAVSSWVPETAFQALEDNLTRTITWFSGMYDNLWALSQGDDADLRQEDFDQKMANITSVATLTESASTAFQSAFDAMLSMSTNFVGKGLKLPTRDDIDSVFGFVGSVLSSATTWFAGLTDRSGAGPADSMTETLGLLKLIDEAVTLALSMYDRITAKNTTGGQTFGMVVQGLVSVYQQFSSILQAIDTDLSNLGLDLNMQWFNLGSGLMDALIEGLRSGIPSLENVLEGIAGSLRGFYDSYGLAPSPVEGGWNFTSNINNYGSQLDTRGLLTGAYSLYKMRQR